MVEFTKKTRILSLLSTLFTFFVDNLGWSIVFPIFAPYFLDENNHIFASDVSLTTRTSWLGFFLMAFPLAQFLGAPVLGEIADRFGRKKGFILSVLLTFVGYCLTAWALMTQNLTLLFIARFISGLFSGNLSICLATISDISVSKKAKLRNYTHLSIIAGLSFILGAFLGGKLSDKAVNPIFSPSFPLWIAAALSFLNLLFVSFLFTETFHHKKDVQFDFLESFHNIRDALKTEKIKLVFVIYFLFVFGWTIIFQFSPVLVIKKFSFTNSEIGDLAAFMGICWALGSGLIHRWLAKIFPSARILEVTLWIFTILCIAITFQNILWSAISLLGICGIIGGIAWPICSALVSNLTSAHMQGKVLGMSQSMQSLAMAVSPLIAGVSDQAYVHLPFILAGVAAFFGSILYFRLKL